MIAVYLSCNILEDTEVACLFNQNIIETKIRDGEPFVTKIADFWIYMLHNGRFIFERASVRIRMLPWNDLTK